MKTFIKSAFIIMTASLAISTVSFAGDSGVKEAVGNVIKILMTNPTVGADGTSYDFAPSASSVCSEIFGDDLSTANCTSHWSDFHLNFTQYEDKSIRFKFYYGSLMPASMNISSGGEITVKIYNHDFQAKLQLIMDTIAANGGESTPLIAELFPKTGSFALSLIKGTGTLEAQLKVLEAFTINKNFGATGEDLIIELAENSELSLKTDRGNLKNFAKFDFSGLHVKIPASASPLGAPIELDGTQLAAFLGFSDDAKAYQLGGLKVDGVNLKLNDTQFAALSSNSTTGSVKFTQFTEGARLELENNFYLSLVIDDSILQTGLAPSGTYFFKNNAGSFFQVQPSAGLPAGALSHIPNPNFGLDENGNPYYYGITSDVDPTIMAKSFSPETSAISFNLSGIEVSGPMMGGVHGLINSASGSISAYNTADNIMTMEGTLSLGTGYIDMGDYHLISFNQTGSTTFESGASYVNGEVFQQVYLDNALGIEANLEQDLYTNLLPLPAGFGLLTATGSAGTLLSMQGGGLSLSSGSLVITNNSNQMFPSGP